MTVYLKVNSMKEPKAKTALPTYHLPDFPALFSVHITIDKQALHGNGVN